jgi:hypothetical protein
VNCRATLAMLPAIILAIAACASPSSSGVVSLADPSATPGASGAPTAPGSADPEEQMLAFQRCMREHGVDVQISIGGPGSGGTVKGGGDSGGGDAGGQPPKPVDPETARAAEAACRQYLPNGGRDDPSATMDPAIIDQLLKFAQCMRDHGVDFPDPQFDGSGRVSIGVGGPDTPLDPSSETFRSAQEACAKDLPGAGPGVIVGQGSVGQP